MDMYTKQENFVKELKRNNLLDLFEKTFEDETTVIYAADISINQYECQLLISLSEIGDSIVYTIFDEVYSNRKKAMLEILNKYNREETFKYYITSKNYIAIEYREMNVNMFDEDKFVRIINMLFNRIKNDYLPYIDYLKENTTYLV